MKLHNYSMKSVQHFRKLTLFCCQLNILVPSTLKVQLIRMKLIITDLIRDKNWTKPLHAVKCQLNAD